MALTDPTNLNQKTWIISPFLALILPKGEDLTDAIQYEKSFLNVLPTYSLLIQSYLGNDNFPSYSSNLQLLVPGPIICVNLTTDSISLAAFYMHGQGTKVNSSGDCLRSRDENILSLISQVFGCNGRYFTGIYTTWFPMYEALKNNILFQRPSLLIPPNKASLKSFSLQDHESIFNVASRFHPFLLITLLPQFHLNILFPGISIILIIFNLWRGIYSLIFSKNSLREVFLYFIYPRAYSEHLRLLASIILKLGT